MFSKMRESKGFTLVELMIVVAIIGILAAVAVPYYQKYIQKSRLTSMVFPGMHIIETNIASYYSLNEVFPTGNTFTTLCSDANTAYFKPALTAGGSLTLTLQNGGQTNPLHALGTGNSAIITIQANTNGGKLTSWTMSGVIATNLGLAGPQ